MRILLIAVAVILLFFVFGYFVAILKFALEILMAIALVAVIAYLLGRASKSKN